MNRLPVDEFWTNRIAAKSEFLISGSADNSMKLWQVSTGKCLFTWEFPTAVKRVTFSEDDDQVVCITEQRMGYQGAIRIFDINREDGTKRMLHPVFVLTPSLTWYSYFFHSILRLLMEQYRITRTRFHVPPNRFKSDCLHLRARSEYDPYRS